MRRRTAWAAAALLLHAAAQAAAFVLPMAFQPQEGADSFLFPLFTNTSLDGVFVAGLSFGTPAQQLQLLLDTGSGVAHVAGAGCGSACGLGLPPSAGYNVSASSTAHIMRCGDGCSCAQCSCDTESGQKRCRYSLAYVDGSTSQGFVVNDVVGAVAPARRQTNLTFGVEQRQTGTVQAQGTQGLLAMDRSRSSVVGQLRAQNQTEIVPFGTCWEMHKQGSPGLNATSFLMMGLPEAIISGTQPSWSPLLDLPDEWAIGIESIEVEGPGGGTVSSELWPPPAAPVPAAAPEAAASGARPVESAPDAGTFSSSGGSSSDPVANTGRSGAALEDQPASPDAPPSRLEQRLRRLAQAAESSGSSGSSQRQYATCFVDSGTTFVVLPRPAWQAFQRLIISAAAALGKTKLVQQAAGATCWESSVPGSLAGNASALEAAFPRIRLSFVGSANFTADGRGFLTSPDSGGERYACLSFFPWPTTASPRVAGSVLLGSRVRQGVLTISDDIAGRVGFANVEDCSRVARDWEAAQAAAAAAGAE